MEENFNKGVLFTTDQAPNILNIGVGDVGASMQRFGWIDYVVFVCMLVICLIIGVYFCLVDSGKTTQDYLIGGRSMKIIPVSMSLIASFISGISLLGIPTEIYVYGIQYLYILGGVVIMGIIFQLIYLPVFHNLNITSTYEYLERRFDRKTRLFGSILFTTGLMTWLPVVIYVPALAFNQVTGINVHLITPTVCVICIVYTTIGGLKAVIWTDLVQMFFMIGAMVLVIVKGTVDVGGFNVVWDRNLESGRIEGPNFDMNPLARHTVWTLTIGGGFYLLQSAGMNQNMIQRYLALPNFKSASISLWLFIFGMFVVLFLCSYSGMLIYATYHQCDPLTTLLAKEKDQLLPLLVMEVLGDYPGLPGLFVAGVFSAALSSLSTGLNSMAAIVLEDFYKSLFTKTLTEKQSYMLMKGTVLLLGALCVGLVFVVEKLGTVLQLTMSIGAITAGPCQALFSMGMLLPWINSRGARIGSACGVIFMSWLCLKAQTAIVTGDLTFPEKPVHIDGCHYDFTANEQKFHLNFTDIMHTDETFMMYRISYLWYTLVGAGFSIIVGVVATFIDKPLDPRNVDPSLLAPFVRRLIPPRHFPNQPNSDDIIYAYEISARNLNSVTHNTS